MRRLIIALSVVLALSSNGRAAAPTVTSVSAAQRTDDSGIVDIFYTLGHADGLACTVGVLVSPDGGSSWMVPPPALSGDVGPSISPGERHIEWPSKVVLPGAYGTQYRVRVIADDGVADPWSGPPPGMVFVSIADRDFAGQMSRYETTNAQYCHFLNAALASGDITVSGNDAMGASGSNSGADYAGELYYNGDGAGTTYNGATNGGAARIFYSAGAFHVDVGFGNHPVTYVTWYGAMAFADYYGYYLPTEEQWQGVADYTGTYLYGCGTSLDNSKANYHGSTHPHGTTTVGSFGQYGYRMSDMAGNAWEWTSSIYSGSSRVLRGGSWHSNGTFCTVSGRVSYSPDDASFYVGFRVCR